MLRVLFISFALILISTFHVEAKEIYVIHEKADAQLKNKFPQAFSSIQQALKVFQPGDTLFISGGIYEENITLEKFGKVDQWATIKALNNEEVVIDGSKADAAAFFVKNSQYVIIDGLHFTKAKQYGLVFWESNHVEARNCRASLNVWEGFLAIHSSHSNFIDCIGHDNVHDAFNFNDAKDSIMSGCIQYNGGNGLSIERGSQNILVENNIFFNNWVDAILVYKNCKDIVIKNNSMYVTYYQNPLDNGQGHCMKITHGNENIQVIDNRAASCAAAFSYEIAGNKNVQYLNNTLDQMGRRIPTIPTVSRPGDVLFKGPGDYSTFIDCRWYSFEEIEKNGWGSGNTYDDLLSSKMAAQIKELKTSGKIRD